ncbi:Mitochondrial carrier homolog 1 [Carabus blaptoides fortunei]
MSSKQNENVWKNHVARIALNTVTHPVEYAKVLIQIGYEPVPPKPSTTFFGKPALKLPNVFQYVKYIKSVDGVVGCYRGIVPKLCGNVVSVLACHKVLETLELTTDVNEDESGEDTEHTDGQEMSDEEREKEKFIKGLKRDIISRFTAIIVSHPFHVITIRMMAQFVGREMKYNGMFGSVVQIYKENGVFGFFSGLIPRLLGDILSILLANTLTYAVNTYVVEEAELKMYSSATLSFLASALTYPFQVVSTSMAVTNSGLMAGSPPYMPIYTSWLDCWSNLSEANQLKRGSSLLMRYYTGPQVVISGKAMPLSKNQFKF